METFARNDDAAGDLLDEIGSRDSLQAIGGRKVVDLENMGDDNLRWGHVPVLYQEVLDGIQPHPGGLYIDATVGSGGHAAGILSRSNPDGQVLGIDADPAAIDRAAVRLAPWGNRARLVQGNFRHLQAIVQQIGWDAVDGIVLDLGISSPQLATAERGFSFQHDGPLDMRMDPRQPLSAATLVNTSTEQELSTLIHDFGEERQARRIARAIVAARQHQPILTTTQLAELVVGAIGRHRAHAGDIHPATRTFQALRIAVNGELSSLQDVLPQLLALLRPGGRFAIIAFHSLEDRLVKHFIQQETRQCICPPSQPICTCSGIHFPRLRSISRGAIQAGSAEVAVNRRSRSARLRVAERLPAPSIVS